MKINLQGRLIENKLAGETYCHNNGFARKLAGKENSEMIYFLKKLGKNEQLRQKSWNLVTHACDYAIAMAPLKVEDTQISI